MDERMDKKVKKANASLQNKKVKMPDPVRSDGWTDGQKSEEGQCTFTKQKEKMSDPVRSDGWTDGQQK